MTEEVAGMTEEVAKMTVAGDSAWQCGFDGGGDAVQRFVVAVGSAQHQADWRLAAALIALLSFFWVGRKLNGTF